MRALRTADVGEFGFLQALVGTGTAVLSALLTVRLSDSLPGAAIAGPEESDVAVRAEAVAPLAVGARVPSVTVQDIDGKPVALDEAIGSGAVALIFYRGGW